MDNEFDDNINKVVNQSNDIKMKDFKYTCEEVRREKWYNIFDKIDDPYARPFIEIEVN